MVGKRCTRCKGGIYTAWRTLDQKKVYHPQCFTCAICDVILDSAKECGVANLQEIYCNDCYMQYFREDSKAKRRQSRPKSVKSVEQEILTALTRTSQRTLSPPQRPCVNTSKSSQLPSTPVRQKFQSDDASETLERAKDGMINASQNYEAKTIRNNRSSNCIVRKTSRIPRPTSANSKKFSTSEVAATSSLPRAKSIVLQNIGKTGKTSPRIIDPNKHKMHRSMSLVRPNEASSQNWDANLSKCVGNSKSSTQCPRTRSTSRTAATRMRLEQSNFAENSVPVPKRQCAASFFNNHEEWKKVDSYNHQNMPTKCSITDLPNPKQETRVTHLNQDCCIPMKSALPSTKDILNVIKRGSSDLITLKSVNHIIASRTSRSSWKRSFKITFDCPICISSLVQGNNGSVPLLGGQPGGNVVTICGHLFHRECMENWLKIRGNKRCPICSALCLPETLQAVYLECNVSADVRPSSNKSLSQIDYGNGFEQTYANATLRHEYDLLKAKYEETLQENRDCALKGAIVESLQSAYDMECRNRLQLQWENKKLMRRIEEMQKTSSI